MAEAYLIDDERLSAYMDGSPDQIIEDHLQHLWEDDDPPDVVILEGNKVLTVIRVTQIMEEGDGIAAVHHLAANDTKFYRVTYVLGPGGDYSHTQIDPA